MYGQRTRLLALALLVALTSCERPYPGWKVIPPGHRIRRACEARGAIALRDRDGADGVDEAATQELRRRFPNLDPSKR